MKKETFFGALGAAVLGFGLPYLVSTCSNNEPSPQGINITFERSKETDKPLEERVQTPINEIVIEETEQPKEETPYQESVGDDGRFDLWLAQPTIPPSVLTDISKEIFTDHAELFDQPAFNGYIRTCTNKAAKFDVQKLRDMLPIGERGQIPQDIQDILNSDYQGPLSGAFIAPLYATGTTLEEQIGAFAQDKWNNKGEEAWIHAMDGHISETLWGHAHLLLRETHGNLTKPDDLERMFNSILQNEAYMNHPFSMRLRAHGEAAAKLLVAQVDLHAREDTMTETAYEQECGRLGTLWATLMGQGRDYNQFADFIQHTGNNSMSSLFWMGNYLNLNVHE